MTLKNRGNQNVSSVTPLREQNGSGGNENMPIREETRLRALRFTARANYLSITQRTAHTFRSIACGIERTSLMTMTSSVESHSL